MKKIILAFVATVMTVGFVYSWLNSRAEQSVLSDIQLANIEAWQQVRGLRHWVVNPIETLLATFLMVMDN